MMDIPHLDAVAPVPLHINPLYSGQIDWLVAGVRLQPIGSRAIISGWAQWRWNDVLRSKVSRLPYSLRLAEPAYVHGIGFFPGTMHTRSLGDVKPTDFFSSVALYTPHIDPFAFSRDVHPFDTIESLCWCLNHTDFLEWFDHTVVRPWGCRYTLNVNNRSKELLLIKEKCTVAWGAFVSDLKNYTKRSHDAMPT